VKAIRWCSFLANVNALLGLVSGKTLGICNGVWCNGELGLTNQTVVICFSKSILRA